LKRKGNKYINIKNKNKYFFKKIKNILKNNHFFLFLTRAVTVTIES